MGTACQQPSTQHHLKTHGSNRRACKREAFQLNKFGGSRSNADTSLYRNSHYFRFGEFLGSRIPRNIPLEANRISQDVRLWVPKRPADSVFQKQFVGRAGNALPPYQDQNGTELLQCVILRLLDHRGLTEIYKCQVANRFTGFR